ncbi:MAG TPA: PHP domain-containing protein, partial [Hyphomicrobiaceae bacterium]|nr:PHP domain-containing protein [Hyphomicrobiaceae bacterium]
MPSLPYAELQAISNYSFLEGGSHPDELVARAKELGLAALAIADRNTLAGVVRAHVAAREAGLRLIVGARLELTPTGKGDPPVLPALICLPTDRAAYGRLCRLLSLGQMRAEKSRCRIHLDDVAAHAEGQILIAIPPPGWSWRETRLSGSGLPQGAPAEGSPGSAGRIIRFPGRNKQGPEDPLARLLTRMRRTLAPAQLYLAASHRLGGDDELRLSALARIATAARTPLVATGDILYHSPERRPLQDILACIRLKTTIDRAGLLLAANAERHLKRPDEMAKLFAAHPQAVARSLEIAEACRFSLDELVYEYPDEPVPAGTTAQAHLE